VASLILINGEEEFLKERAAREEAHASLTSHTAEYTLPKGLNEYLEEVQMTTVDGGTRSFILWDVSEIPYIPTGNDVVIAVSAGKKILSDSRARRVHNFPKLKTFDDNNDVIKWILKEGEALNIDLSRVAGALFVNCGNGLRKISSEIRKLSVITPKGGTVLPEKARLVMCFSAELTPKQIIDAICEGQTIRALAFHDKLQENGDETGWILAYMQRHVVQQIRLQTLVDGKVPDVAERLGIHPFLYKKMVLPRLGLWASASLMSSLNTLCDLDIMHKRGNTLARYGLESEIVRLSEEAQNGKRRR